MPFTVTDEEREELAVTYAALILHDDKVAITADKLEALCKAAKVDVQAFWPSLFARVLADRDLDDILLNPGAGGGAPAGGGAAAAGAAAGGAAEEKKEEKKEESEEEESDEEMGFGLFD